MRRASKKQSISPQQLKHFAVAAAAITCLLALFASGEDWGAKAQIEAVEAKNRAIAAETEKLGTRKIAANLNANRSAPAMGDGGGGGSDFGGGGGGGYVPAAAPVAPTSQPRLAIPVTPRNATVRVERDDFEHDPASRSVRSKRFMQRGAVSAEQSRQIRANVRAQDATIEGAD